MSAGWIVSDDIVIGYYVIHYADGEQRELPISHREDVRDWIVSDIEPIGGASPAWRGTNDWRHNIRLYRTTWSIPRPDVEITSIYYVSAMTDSAPFLIAITAE